MTEMITQCPKCSTAFHVTEEHLNAARGSVRCGSCMTVFNGRANLLENAIDDRSVHDNIYGELPSIDEADISFSTSSSITSPVTDAEDEDGYEEVAEDESWALKLLEEEGHEPSQIGLVKKDENQKHKAAQTHGEAKTLHPPVAREITKDEPQQAAAPSPAKPANQLIDAIETDSVELSYVGNKRFWQTKYGLLLMVIFGALLLSIQVAWLKYGELNKTEPYRSYYGMACKVIGCTLPELVDKSLIKTSNLIVRSHPDKEKALLVEVLIKNEATFTQPFPHLSLRFKDIRDTVLAKRTFTPQDYLAGEVIDMKLMPIKQPIRIRMELVDPGEGAVSYDMSIVGQ